MGANGLSGSSLLMVLSLVAGVLGTLVGGIIGAFLSNNSAKTITRILSFAAGVMLGIVCFEMLPEAYEYTIVNAVSWTGVVITISSLIGGVLVIWISEKIVLFFEKKQESKMKAGQVFASSLHEGECLPCEEKDKIAKRNKKLAQAGFVMFVAIALHNFPEGMAIGSSGIVNEKSGILLATLITLHNIPEGMSISAPLAGSGVAKWKSILLSALAGSVTILGAGIGILIGEVSKLASGIALGFASGAMVYVIFDELILECASGDAKKQFTPMMLLGFVLSMGLSWLI